MERLSDKTGSEAGANVISRCLLPVVLAKSQVSKACLRRDFPGGTVVGNPPANAGDTGLIPGLGRSHVPRSN